MWWTNEIGKEKDWLECVCVVCGVCVLFWRRKEKSIGVEIHTHTERGRERDRGHKMT